MITVDISFAADHPTAAGHFPGHPVIPGAVLLDEIIHVLQTHLGRQLPALEIRSAKFLHPVVPGDRVGVVIDAVSDSEFRFECRTPLAVAVTGTLRCADPPAAARTA